MAKIDNYTPTKIPIFYDKELLDDVRLLTINPGAREITDISFVVSELCSNNNEFEDRVKTLESNSGNSDVDLGPLTNRVSSVEQVTSSLKSDIDLVVSDIGTIDVDIVNLIKKTDDMVSDTVSLGDKTNTLSEAIADLVISTDGLNLDVANLDTNLTTLNEKVLELENKPSTVSEPEKFYILPILGQSNGVGYGELPYDINGEDNINPRIKQLGRYGGSADGVASVDNVNKTTTNYGDRFSELRPYTDCNLKVIPAVPCLDSVQNMFQHQKGGTTGFGMYVAKLLLQHIPKDYGILLIPCARGGSAFSSNTVGTYNTSRMYCSENALKQGVGTPLGNSNYDRVKHALGLHKDNKMLPILWVQGEMDQGKAELHLASFEAYFNWYRDKFVEDGLEKHLPSGSIKNFRWFCFSSTKWMMNGNAQVNYIRDPIPAEGGLGRLSVYDNYVYLSNKYRELDGTSPLVYVRADVDYKGTFIETNREQGNGVTTATREIHFSTHGNRVQLPQVMFNAICGYSNALPLPLSSRLCRSIRGGASTVITDNVSNQYTKPLVDFDTNDKLLVYQSWPVVNQSEKLTNKAVGSSAVISGATACTIKADTTFGGVMNFNNTSGSQINTSLGKGETSFTKSIVFKPTHAVRGQNSNVMSMGEGGTDSDGICWFVNGSLFLVPNYKTSERSVAMPLNPCLVGSWNGSLSDWQHLVITYNKAANLYTAYLNGSLVGQLYSKGLTLNKVCIGNYSNTALRFTGDVANYRIYEKCLTHGEVGSLWHCDLKNYFS